MVLASCCGPPLPDVHGVLIWTWVMGVCGLLLTLEGIGLLVVAHRRQRALSLQRQKLPIVALIGGIVALGLALDGRLTYTSLIATQPGGSEWDGNWYGNWYAAVGSAVTMYNTQALIVAIITLALLGLGVARALMDG
ncbi:MAG: hypothetical protein ABI068_00225 [Ktedonobacterales bacterium]